MSPFAAKQKRIGNPILTLYGNVTMSDCGFWGDTRQCITIVKQKRKKKRQQPRTAGASASQWRRARPDGECSTQSNRTCIFKNSAIWVFTNQMPSSASCSSGDVEAARWVHATETRKYRSATPHRRRLRVDKISPNSASQGCLSQSAGFQIEKVETWLEIKPVWLASGVPS